MSKSKKYKYMISYTFSCKLIGMAAHTITDRQDRIFITVDNKIKTEDDILALEDYIKTNVKGCTDLRIYGIYRLKE